MTLNDFKSIEGDRLMNVRSLPVQLGPRRAALLACAVMALPQAIVASLFWVWQQPLAAATIAGVLSAQLLLMPRLLAQPRERAPWYNATGVSLYVSGMMCAAFALRAMASA